MVEVKFYKKNRPPGADQWTAKPDTTAFPLGTPLAIRHLDATQFMELIRMLLVVLRPREVSIDALSQTEIIISCARAWGFEDVVVSAEGYVYYFSRDTDETDPLEFTVTQNQVLEVAMAHPELCDDRVLELLGRPN